MKHHRLSAEIHVGWKQMKGAGMSNIFPEKKLGFGLMRLPLLDEKVKTSIDIEQMKKMVDLFLDRKSVV